ncbi:AMP-binding protein (plasmid) [Ponticoccus alexandrii]|uniref:AMP-binding protein n=2 Tax=Ponticoccus alexandrii TaxID=1943633 RepID=A0ABX7FFW3_9RHOB|nr:AMP-dependent synthetase [Rhodobacteraceae bacterium PD-2]QRF69408.1 AMP-binding protein [Ponticoccus alexandrii]
MANPENNTLWALLQADVAARPDAIYAHFNGEPITFRELAARATATSDRLRDHGAVPGDRIATMCRNSVEALILTFALARSGLVWVPVNARLKGDGLAYILGHSGPRLVVADPDMIPTIDAATGTKGVAPVLALRDDLTSVGLSTCAEASGAAYPSVPTAPADTWAIMYTSGTTGHPKGVIVTYRMLDLATQAVAATALIKEGDVMFAWEPFYHIGGAQLLPLPMRNRTTIAFVDRFSAGRFWSQVAECGATHIHYLGGILQILMKQPASPADRAHRVRVAWGAGCVPEIWESFETRFGLRIRECYGMTEASSVTTFNDSGTPGVVGRPVPWFEVEILDENGNRVAEGARGEIVVTPLTEGALFPGYLDNPEATAKALRNGRMHTGDSGSLLPTGELVFHGRMTDSVRCKGENVSAWEVEHVANKHSDVEECAMVGVATDIGEQDIMLFVKPKAGASFEEAKFVSWLADHLAAYQVPRYIQCVAAFQHTPSERIMKHKLPKTTEKAWDRLRLTAK